MIRDTLPSESSDRKRPKPSKGKRPVNPHSKRGGESFYGDTRRNHDGTWKHGIDRSLLNPEDFLSNDSDVDAGGEFDYDSSWYTKAFSLGLIADKSTFMKEWYSQAFLAAPMLENAAFYRDHWLIDSGCSDHLTPYLEDFSHLGTRKRYASTADGSLMEMLGPGTVVLQQQKLSPVVLQDVWLSPTAAHRLLSVTALTRRGYRCAITDQTKLWDRQGRLVIQASALLPTSRLHWFQSCSIIPTGTAKSLQDVTSSQLWHLRLGHPSKNVLRNAHKYLLGIPPLDSDIADQDNHRHGRGSKPCRGCQLGKATQREFPPSASRSDRVLGLVHTDLCEFPIQSRSHAKWMMTFLDDHSGFASLHFLRSKSDAVRALKDLIAWAETQTGFSFRALRSDRGGEYINHELASFLSSRGIEHQTSVPRTPQQNGRAERFNRTILEKAEAMRQTACLPPSFWQDAVDTALHIYNRQPLRRLGWNTPFSIWKGEKPDVSYFRVFGTLAYVFIPKEDRANKLSPKAEEMTFIGYEQGTKGYRFWSPTRRRVVISSTATFDEEVFPHCTKRLEDRPLPLPDSKDSSSKDESDDSDSSDQDGPEPSRKDVSDPYNINIHLDGPPNQHVPPPDGNQQPSPPPDTQPPPPASPSPSSRSPSPSLHDEPMRDPSPLAPRRPAPIKPDPKPATWLDPTKSRARNFDPEQIRPKHLRPHIKRPIPKPPILESARELPRHSDDPTGTDIPRRSTRVPQPRIIPDSVYGQRTGVQVEMEGDTPLSEPSGSSVPPPPRKPTNEEDDLGEMYSARFFNRIIAAAAPAINIPKQYRDVLRLPKEEQKKWHEAMHEEIKSLQQRNVWELVDLPSNRQPIKGRWVYAVKSDGRIKARFVAKGFTQIFGIDFEETFSPVARFETVRLLLSLAALEDWEIEALDVKTAFLYGELDEEIYMEQPEGFKVKGAETKVCRLRKAIYGLKQAALQWNKALHQSLLDMGFQRIHSDPGVYVHFHDNDIILLVIYVDDSLFMGSNPRYLFQKKKEFMTKWECRDLGAAKEYLGMRITRDRKKRILLLDQISYAEKVIKRFNLQNAKPARTPLPSVYIPAPYKKETTPALRSRYQSVIGSLLYIMLGTRPDIAYAVIKMSQFSANPSEEHLQKALYIVRYLATHQSLCIRYNGLSLSGFLSYSDTDWAGDVETRRSTTGYAIFLADGIVSWLSRRQRKITLSSTEAEYVGMTEAAKQLHWIRNLFSEIGFSVPVFTLLCDNQGAIFLASNPAQEGRTKHIEIPEHYIRECVQDGTIQLFYIPTGEQVADIFTKNVTWQKFEDNRKRLTLVPFQP